jgi:hypothetical protein
MKVRELKSMGLDATREEAEVVVRQQDVHNEEMDVEAIGTLEVGHHLRWVTSDDDLSLCRVYSIKGSGKDSLT